MTSRPGELLTSWNLLSVSASDKSQLSVNQNADAEGLPPVGTTPLHPWPDSPRIPAGGFPPEDTPTALGGELLCRARASCCSARQKHPKASVLVSSGGE